MNRLLRIYLNDQLAMGIGWRELARRAERANRGTDLGQALARVSQGIAGDVDTFRIIMDRLDMRPSPVKTGLAVVAERAGRLKPNGRLRSYSPLSRFVEIEILAMGIEGKKQLWTTLRDIAELGDSLPGIDFDELLERAAWQRRELEPFRTRAGRDAFTARQPVSDTAGRDTAGHETA